MNMASAEWQAVREALERARQWDIARATGGMHVATRPDPMRAIRALVRAEREEAINEGA